MLEEGQPLEATMLDPVCGVYEIKNTANGKCYIGQSIQVQSRWTTHFIELSKGVHNILLMQQDWDEYGPDHFQAQIVRIVDAPDKLRDIEEEIAQERLDSGTNLYNARIAGWQNEAEYATRVRVRTREAEKNKVLQRKTESADEARNPRGSDSGNKATISGQGNLPSGGGLSGDSTGPSLESDKRGIRIEEAGLRSGEQESDRETGTEGPAQQGVDENGQREKSYQDYKEILSILDDRAGEILLRFAEGLTERPERYLKGLKNAVERDPYGHAYAIRAFCDEETVQTTRDILDSSTLTFWFDSQDEVDKMQIIIKDAGYDDPSRWALALLDGSAELVEA